MEKNRWNETVEFFEWLKSVDGAASATGLAQLEVLAWARPRWESRVNVHSSMHWLVFTNYADSYPWPAELRVEWSGGVYTVRVGRPGDADFAASDRCREGKIHDVLDAFLGQLLASNGRATPLSPRPPRGRGPLRG